MKKPIFLLAALMMVFVFACTAEPLENEETESIENHEGIEIETISIDNDEIDDDEI